MSSIANKSFSSREAAVGTLDFNAVLWRFLTALGSLRIAVAMFGLGTLLLFVGTLAQDQETIVDVKRHYFNSWIAYVPFDVFVPSTIWPHEEPIPFGFLMPGGASIGLALLINLFAAKLTRFKMNAKGGRFWGGMLITLLGFALVGLVIMSAHLGDGLQGEPPFSYDWLWLGTKWSAHALTLMTIGWLVLSRPKNRVILYTGVSTAAIFAAVSLLLLWTGDSYRIPDPGLRIVWQLTKSLGVGIVLLVGLTILFGQRGGNVLIHFGVGLLMLGQFIFGDAQREERMSIVEGQQTSVVSEIDSVELVVIDRSGDDGDRVVAFNQHMLRDSASSGRELTADGLPFSIRIDKWMENSTFRSRAEPPKPDSPEAKMKGLVQEYDAQEVPKAGGATSESNISSAYYTVFNKADKSEMGSYLASQWLSDELVIGRKQFEKIEAASKTYEIGIQFRRNYKDYTVTLDDVVLEQYTNTAIPKDYSSYITIKDKDGNVLQDGRVWMNSPLRFRGETFYQSSYTPSGESRYGTEQTVLQVVTNAGWLIPYVSCVLVGIGMLFHFSGTFARFAMRYERGAIAIPSMPDTQGVVLNAGKSASKKKGDRKDAGKPSRTPWILGGAFAFFMSAYSYYIFLPPKTDRERVDYDAIGKLTVNYGGRTKPLSSAGAEILQILSNKPYALMMESQGDGKEPKEVRISSSQWLFDIMMTEEWTRSNPLIRIDAPEATGALGLTRVKSNRYSYNDVVDGLQAIWPRMTRIIQSTEDRERKLPFEDEKLLEVLNKVSLINSLFDSYRPIAPESIKSGDINALRQEIDALEKRVAQVRRAKGPTILPSFTQPVVAEGERAPPLNWDAFGPLFFDSLPKALEEKKSDSMIALEKFIQLSMAYQENKTQGAKINRLVEEYREAAVKAHGEDVMRTEHVAFEHQFQRTNLFSKCGWLYLFLGVLATLSFVVMPKSLRVVALVLCISAFLLQTYGIWARIVISERPPVVSLYSAAIFIGWAMVLFCIVAELFYPIRVSLLIAATSGYLSLLVAYGLDTGDTTPVLQAVLDTQFWLSTHVISVTLGYSATFFAGLFGIAIVVVAAVAAIAGRETPTGKEYSDYIPVLYRITYAVVCFGLFFSFVGTVLGGLWGDDSWGRFWGWDPKENGALMIVLWNALLLHARWDKLVGALGFANLAIFGNIITAWSMFGTNQLGIGLHAYGAFEGQILKALAVWGAAQLVFMGIGIVVVAMNRKQNAVGNVSAA
jgi:ABC-type transport system involved in cytochrome c biogenesis permease subunit